MISLLREQLKLHEGYRQFPYKCTAGKLTIGYGHNLDDVGLNEALSTIVLDADISTAINELLSIFPGFSDFKDLRQVALVDMMFNLGSFRFRKFKKMIAAIEEGNWKLAAEEAKNSRWYMQVGRRARTVVRQLEEG